MEHVSNPEAHLQRLTTLLEDIVSTADAVALHVAETHERKKPLRLAANRRQETARLVLSEIAQGLRVQAEKIDGLVSRWEQ
jgi:transposase